MESAIYAQYADAEIREVDPADDYLKQFKKLPNEKYEMFGTDIIFHKPSAYPIRTYLLFEDSIEERRIDPISSLAETMSRLKDDEQIWIQYLIRPAGPEWKDEAQKVLDKIMGKKEPKKKGGLDFDLGVSFQDAVLAPLRHPSLEPKDKKKEDREGPLSNILYLSPGERAILEEIELKTAKLGFETTMRFIYVDNREKFSREYISSFMGMLRQFTVQNSNLLKPDKDTLTSAPHQPFKKQKVAWRQRLMHDYFQYLVPSAKSHKTIFNIEELATLYHFPTTAVAAPKLDRVDSRKGGPTPGLPTVG